MAREKTVQELEEELARVKAENVQIRQSSVGQEVFCWMQETMKKDLAKAEAERDAALAELQKLREEKERDAHS
ncbi:MAG: hypothetical protein PHD67_10540 [Oscillospiraceae bacterium]|nr:hypothetical protein [Oscillospiraceae bacterium]